MRNEKNPSRAASFRRWRRNGSGEAVFSRRTVAAAVLVSLTATAVTEGSESVTSSFFDPARILPNASVCCGPLCARVALKLSPEKQLYLHNSAAQTWDLVEGNPLRIELFREGVLLNLFNDFTWQSKKAQAVLKPGGPLMRVCSRVLSWREGESTPFALTKKPFREDGSGCGNTDFADQFVYRPTDNGPARSVTPPSSPPRRTGLAAFLAARNSRGTDFQAEEDFQMLLADETDGSWHQAVWPLAFQAKLMDPTLARDYMPLLHHPDHPVVERSSHPAQDDETEKIGRRGSGDRSLRAQFCFQLLIDPPVAPTATENSSLPPGIVTRAPVL